MVEHVFREIRLRDVFKIDRLSRVVKCLPLRTTKFDRINVNIKKPINYCLVTAMTCTEVNESFKNTFKI